MIRSLIRCAALAGAIGLGACELEVLNPNSPATEQVKATAADLENFLGTQYRRWHASLYGFTGNVWGMANVQSLENYSTLANNCQNARSAIPRPANNNQVGNACGGDQSQPYFQASEAARSVSDVLRRMNEGVTFVTTADDARNRAFAEFVRGVALGYIAMVYDSAAIITPEDPLTPEGTAEFGELSSHSEVMAEALSALEKSLASAPGMSPLPSNWMFTTGTTMNSAEFIKVVRSYRARLRAGHARTPAERAAVDWDAVIADAQNGITADHRITTNSVTGPRAIWVDQWYAYATWHQMTPFIVGMADNSGAYADWIATPLGTRGAGARFFMTTPDQRFPQGATRAAQQADFALTSCTAAGTVCKRFFVNRATSDPAASDSWGGSQYDHARWLSWDRSGTGGSANNGPFTFFAKAELDMLQAEGLYRKGDFAGAAALVNITRTACGPGGVPAGCSPRPAGNGASADPGGGLPAITAFDATTPVPGGADCVPKMPSNANASGAGTVGCGNLLEAIKWEKRIETAYTHFAGWYFDHRGWGDLPEGTPHHWAPPYQDLQSRFRIGEQIYSTGAGLTGAAGPSTYGW